MGTRPSEFKGGLAERAEGRRGTVPHRMVYRPLELERGEGLQTVLPSLELRPGGDYTASCMGARQRVRGRRKGAGEPDRWPRAGPKVRGMRAVPDRKAVSLPARHVTRSEVGLSARACAFFFSSPKPLPKIFLDPRIWAPS